MKDLWKAFQFTVPLWPSTYLGAICEDRAKFLERLKALVEQHYSAVTLRFIVGLLGADALLFHSFRMLPSVGFVLSLPVVYFVALHIVNRVVYKDAKQFQMLEYISNVNKLSTAIENADEVSGGRPELLLKNHELTLQRYYSQNLSQNAVVLWGAFGCIVGGVALTAWGLSAALSGDESGAKRLEVVATIVSGILVNIVAAIMLTIYRGVQEALRSFHGRIVSTHHCYVAYFIAAQLPAGPSRNAALEDLARATLASSKVDQTGVQAGSG